MLSASIAGRDRDDFGFKLSLQIGAIFWSKPFE
jgi:hypothetical protein